MPFLDAVHTLAGERRLSRFMYLASKPSALGSWHRDGAGGADCRRREHCSIRASSLTALGAGALDFSLEHFGPAVSPSSMPLW